MGCEKLFGESLIHLPEVPPLVANRVGLSCVKSWVVKGVRGVKLESIAVGGKRMTSIQAVERFVARLNASPMPATSAAPEPAAAAAVAVPA